MARRPPRVLAIGDAIVDVVTPPLEGLPRGDVQLSVPRFDLLPGGNATNFVLQMASLGARTRFIGSIGVDPFGSFLRRAYREGGVAARLRVDRRRPTGSTLALTWSDGARALITALGANASLQERDVSRSELEAADHVHRAGFWWTERLQGGPTARILARARRSGATTSMDIATDPKGWPANNVDLVRNCLPQVTTFFGNETEVSAVAGVDDPLEAARELCRMGVEDVVVHCGGGGAAWVCGAQTLRSPAFRVRADNPTGCGDVFNAGYVLARFEGEATPAALAFANACAALHLEHRARPYPGRAVVERFLRQRMRQS